MFWAEKGIGAYLNDRRIRVSARRQLADALIGTGIPFGGRGDHPAYLATLARVMAATSGVRRLGAAALDLAYVAAGRYDGFWEFGLRPWDIAAGLLLVREAGGFVSDLAGGQTMMTSGDVLAANGHLHLPLAALIREAMRQPPPRHNGGAGGCPRRISVSPSGAFGYPGPLSAISARLIPAAPQGMGPAMETALVRQPRVSPAAPRAGRATPAIPDRHG